MSANDNPYAAPDVVETFAPGESWLRGRSPGLIRTATGLSFVYYGILAIVVSVIFLVLVLVNPVLVLVSGVVFALGNVMLLIGPILCLAVPSETGAKRLIAGAVSSQLTVVVLTLGEGVVPSAFPEVLRFVSSIAVFLSNVLFVLFMRRLAGYIGRLDLSARATNVLVWGVITVGSFLGLSLVGPLPGGWRAAWAAVGILVLVVFVMYANLVNSLRLAIKPGLKAGGASDG